MGGFYSRRLSRRGFLSASLGSAALALPGVASASAAPPRDEIVGLLRVGTLTGEPVIPLARKHDLSTPALMTANFGLDELLPQTRSDVLLPTAHLLPAGLRSGILINLAEYRLYYLKGGALLDSAPIGIGLPGKETPTGKTSIIAKKENPTWYPTEQARKEHPDWPTSVEPGITNPLGAHALYLAWPAYLIHGSSNDFGIGRPFTRGCIRMFADDVKRLFETVPVGTQVEVVDQPVKLGWHKGELFLEAHPDLEQLDELRLRLAFTPKPAPDLSAPIAAIAGPRAADVDWDVVNAAAERRAGVPVQITSPRTRSVALFAPGAQIHGGLAAALAARGGLTPQQAAARADVLKALMSEELRKDPYGV
ncbi:MAG: L,D-transpeptidase family protein [Alphaproteobacteria bacterium]